MGKNILLFGGAFDPPHIGHLSTALSALEYIESDELWFIPCYSDAFGQKNLSDAHRRLDMVNLMLKDCPISKLYVCEREIEMANQAGTYAIVKDLMRVYPSCDFRYLIGSDQASRIREWRNSRDLLKTIPFVVVNRIGVAAPFSYSWCNYTPHTYIETVNHNIASTGIKLDFAANRDRYREVRHPNLTISVNKYIIEHNLY